MNFLFKKSKPRVKIGLSFGRHKTAIDGVHFQEHVRTFKPLVFCPEYKYIAKGKRKEFNKSSNDTLNYVRGLPYPDVDFTEVIECPQDYDFVEAQTVIGQGHGLLYLEEHSQKLLDSFTESTTLLNPRTFFNLRRIKLIANGGLNEVLMEWIDLFHKLSNFHSIRSLLVSKMLKDIDFYATQQFPDLNKVPELRVLLRYGYEDFHIADVILPQRDLEVELFQEVQEPSFHLKGIVLLCRNSLISFSRDDILSFIFSHAFDSLHYPMENQIEHYDVQKQVFQKINGSEGFASILNLGAKLALEKTFSREKFFSGLIYNATHPYALF